MAKDKKYSYSELFKRLGRYIYDDKGKFIFAIIILVIGSFILSITPKLVGNILDYLAQYVSNGYVGLDETYLILYILGIAVLYILGNQVTIVANRITLIISRNVSKVLRDEMYEKINKVPINYLDTHASGDIMACLTNDLITFETFLSNDLTDFLILVFVMMIVVNPYLTVVYAILLPISFIFTGLITKVTKKNFKLQQSSVGELN